MSVRRKGGQIVRVACHRCRCATEASVQRLRAPRPGEDERDASVAYCVACGAMCYPRSWIDPEPPWFEAGDATVADGAA